MRDGGGGGRDIKVNEDVVRGASEQLISAASVLDPAGKSLPGLGNTGEAAAILGLILAGFAEVGGRLSMESETIGTAAREAVSATADADQRAAAESLLIKGPMETKQ
ncbi:hypothetical protein AB0F44_02740 [Nocardioides sp. NPDC023903]|uniref:hypothetical protein n=1 Tax=Nocardioides sp. NPDC023903 TaxID=3157195 RepID=UPI0033DF752D